MKLTVGTRGSRLSLIQTNFVIQQLTRIFPDLEVEIKIIKTLGDRIASKPLLQIKEKGIFEKEIDRAVFRGEVDFAVHSMKDAPTINPLKTTIVAVPKRESPYDVLVSKDGLILEKLPPGAVVGTGSPRREAELHHIRPDLKVEAIRGNVDTRVRKLMRGLYDAVIIAEAGLQRLSMQHCITERLPLEDFTPSPGQGALAVIAKEDNREVTDTLKRINDSSSMAEIRAERVFVREVGGGCKVPIGAIARASGNTLSLYASVLSPDGKVKVHTSLVGDVKSPEKLGVKVAQNLLKMGAAELIQRWRRLYEEG